MLYLIAGAVLLLLAYWIWGMRKMARMNSNPDQLILANLLVRAGNGEDNELLEFIGQQRWTSLRMKDNSAHALSLAEKLFPADEYGRARTYANMRQDRLSCCRAPQGNPPIEQLSNSVEQRESKPALPTPDSMASPQHIGSSNRPPKTHSPILSLPDTTTELQGFDPKHF